MTASWFLLSAAARLSMPAASAMARALIASASARPRALIASPSAWPLSRVAVCLSLGLDLHGRGLSFRRQAHFLSGGFCLANTDVATGRRRE